VLCALIDEVVDRLPWARRPLGTVESSESIGCPLMGDTTVRVFAQSPTTAAAAGRCES